MTTKTKVKHEHIIEVTVILRKPFEQNNLAQAMGIQKAMSDAASKMDGFHSMSSRMTKAPIGA